MTLWALVGLAVLRAACIAVPAAAAAEVLDRMGRGSGRWSRTLFLGLMILPILTPALLCGYAWSQFSLSLLPYPLANEFLYGLLMVCRLVPLAWGVRRLAERSLPAPSAWHVNRLGSNKAARARIVQQGRMFLILCGAVWLAAMSEFDLASLMQIPTWTVRLFEARSLGAGTGALLREAAVPAALQAAVLAGIFLLARREETSGSWLEPVLRPSKRVRVSGWGILAGMNLMTVVLPAGLIAREAMEASDPVRLIDLAVEQWVAGLVFAGAAALAAWVLVAGLMRIRPRAMGLAVILPALCGGMTLATLVLLFFQLQPLADLAHSPLPLGLGLCLWLLPLAWVLRGRLGKRDSSSHHAARLLSGSADRQAASLARRLWWREAIARGTLATGLLFCWALGDVVLAKVLAPVDYTPMTALLYNQMHYGHNATLALLLAVHVGLPVMLALMAAGLLAGRSEKPAA